MEQRKIASALIIREIRVWFQGVTAWLDISAVNLAVLFSHLDLAAFFYENRTSLRIRKRNARRMNHTRLFKRDFTRLDRKWSSLAPLRIM